MASERIAERRPDLAERHINVELAGVERLSGTRRRTSDAYHDVRYARRCRYAAENVNLANSVALFWDDSAGRLVDTDTTDLRWIEQR